MSLTVLITAASGQQYRLGADEADAAWVPEKIQWGSVLPGGWKEGSFDLKRRIDEDVPLRLLDEVEIIDEHGQSVYEGRIMKLPRQSGDDYQLGVQCLGWASHLVDDKSFREIYVDRGLERWKEPPLARRIALVGSGFSQPGGWSAGVAGGADANPGIAMSHGDLDQPGLVRQVAEFWYDSQGISLAELDYVFTAIGLGNGADPAWTTTAFLATDETGGTTVGAGDHDGANGPVNGAVTTTDPGYKFAGVQVYYNAAYTAGPQAGGWNAWFQLPTVYGQHGVFPNPDRSFYIDDLLANALSRACPKLNFSLGDGGSIERPSVTVLQAAYHDPGSVEPVVLDLNKYVLWDWLVYENRTFFYRPPDPDRLTWEARLDRGIHLSLEGDDAEHIYNGAIVKYALPDGTRRTAGPPGSGFDVVDGRLGDTAPENTVNEHGYPRKWIELDIQFPTLDVYAITIGAAYLAQASLPARSGSVDLFGSVEHPTQGLRPVREVRAGDWVRLSDHPADVPRRIVQTSYSEDGLHCSVTVGNEIDKISALLEQLGVITRVRLSG